VGPAHRARSFNKSNDMEENRAGTVLKVLLNGKPTLQGGTTPDLQFIRCEV